MPANRIIDIRRVEGSVTEPVTLTQAKAHLIITFTDDDTLITSLITQARKAIEEYCAISIVAKTVTLTAFLYKCWELPYGPVTGILSVATRSGTEGSGPATYTTQASGWDTAGEEFLTFNPAGAGFNTGAAFTGYFQWGPYASDLGTGNLYRLVYTAGYTTVPAELKLAIMNELVYRYEHKGEGEISGICEAARVIAEPLKRTLWF